MTTPGNNAENAIGRVNNDLNEVKQGYKINAGAIHNTAGHFEALHLRLGTLVEIIDELFDLDPNRDHGPIGEMVVAVREADKETFAKFNQVTVGTANGKLHLTRGSAAILNDQLTSRRPTWEEVQRDRLHDVTMKLYELVSDVEVARDEAGAMSQNWREMGRRSDQVADQIEEYQGGL